VDEKLQVQGPGPVQPVQPGMPEQRSHDYVGNGITSLFAALDAANGLVIGSIHCWHQAVEFRTWSSAGSPS
jgi:hypothetical protein